MSNIVVSSCPVVAASYVPPAPRRPLLVTPSSTHFKAASYIGCSRLEVYCTLHSFLSYSTYIHSHHPPLDSPGLPSTLPLLPPPYLFFSYKTCAVVRAVPITGSRARFPGGRGQVSIRRTQHKKFLGIQAKLSINQH